MVYNFLIGILPSLIWLTFYLQEDERPEPKGMVLKTFLLGGLFTLPTIFYELLFEEILLIIGPKQSFEFDFWKYLIIALVEEIFKFLVLFFFIFGHREFDELPDGMIYAIIAGLGFAGVENILYVIRFPIFQAIQISILRFLGAVFLHALCGGILGYFLAIFYFQERKIKHLLLGLFLATMLHFLYNFSIISIDLLKEKNLAILPFFFLFLLLFFSAWFVSIFFQRLKKLQALKENELSRKT